MPNYEQARGKNDANEQWDALQGPESNYDLVNEQEQADIIAEQAHIRGKHIMAAAKLLSGSGYEKRHQRTVDNSFNIMRQRGEKLHGSNADRRNEAYLMRLYDRVDERGDSSRESVAKSEFGKVNCAL